MGKVEARLVHDNPWASVAHEGVMSAIPFPKTYVHDDAAVYEAAARRMRASWEGPSAPAPKPPPPPSSQPPANASEAPAQSRPPRTAERKTRTTRYEVTEVSPRPSFALSVPRAPTEPVVPAPHLLPSKFMHGPRARTYRTDAAEPARRGSNRWLQLAAAAGVTMLLGAGVVALFRPKAPPPPAELARCVETAPTVTSAVTPAAAFAPSATPLAVSALPKPPAHAEPLPAVKSLAAHRLDQPAAPRRSLEPARATRPARPSAPAPRPARARTTVARAQLAGKRPAAQDAAPAPKMPSW